MARYLTPSKVALLALVSIYSEGVVPNSAIVALLSFFMTHLLPLDSLGDLAPIHDDIHPVSILQFEKATAGLPSSIPGRTIWDLFLRKLWQLDCMDSFEQFLTQISGLLAKSREELLRDRNNGILPEMGKLRLSRTSPLGMFVRRAQLEYSKLQFHDSVALWRVFLKFRMPTYQAWAKRNPGNQSKVDVNLANRGLDLNAPIGKVVYGDLEHSEEDLKVATSTKDMEKLLDFQVQQMQREGTRITEEMRKKLQRMLASGISLPRASHYARFLDSWRAGDFPSSFDYLHQYFDYTMQGHDRTYYQYALLNLAILQVDFGCFEQAVSAIQEALSIARETQDMNCLNYCLSWLYHCRKAYPSALTAISKVGMLGSDREALMFLQTKARESEMWSLLSTSLLGEVKLDLLNGDSVATIFERLAKTAFLNASQNLNASMGQLLVVQQAAFTRLGLSRLAMATNNLFQECYENDVISGDRLKAAFQTSHLLSLSGRHAQAVSHLEKTSPTAPYTLKNFQQWMFVQGLLKLRQQLHRDNMVAAEHLVYQLRACVPNEPEHKTALCLLEIEFLLRKGEHRPALDLIEQTAKSIQQGPFDVALQVQLLNLKSQLFLKTDQPERAFSLIMRSASIAYKSRVLPGLWEALGILAVVLMTFQEFGPAKNMLESIVPQVLETDDCILAARIYSIIVDANMGLAGQNRENAVRHKEHTASASEYIDCAFQEYSRIGNITGQCEMTSKKAILMQLSGDLALANDYAAKYLDLKAQARQTALGHV